MNKSSTLLFVSLLFPWPLKAVKMPSQKKIDAYNKTMFLKHAATGNIEKLKELVENDKVETAAKDRRNRNALLITLHACNCHIEACCHVQIAHYLIAKDQKIVDKKPHRARSALHILASKGSRKNKPIATNSWKWLATTISEIEPLKSSQEKNEAKWLPKHITYLKKLQKKRTQDITAILYTGTLAHNKLPIVPREIANLIGSVTTNTQQ